MRPKRLTPATLSPRAHQGAQPLVDGGHGEPVALVVGLHHVEMLMEELQRGRLLLVGPVVLLYGPHLVGVEVPAGLAVGGQGVGLSVEALIVGLVVGADGGRELYADEAAAARGVAEYAQVVGGGDKRGVALELLDMLAVRPLDLH